MEAKREGRKIPDVINRVTESITKGKVRAGPFQEDFSAEVDLGPRKIQSWVPDEEEEPSGSHRQPWEDPQAYANPVAAYQQSQGFQQGRIPFQQQNKGNVFQQKQLGAPNRFLSQNVAGQNKSPFTPNVFQQKTPAFSGAQQRGPQQSPSAFQQAMSSFSKSPVPAFPQPSNSASVFNPAAPAFRPTAPAFQQVAPAFAKPTPGPFSQTAPAFSSGTNASAASLGSGFSAKFGQSSASSSQSTAPHKPPADSHLVNKAPLPTPAFALSKQQSHTPNQGPGYSSSEDQLGATWQQEGDWGQEGYYQGEDGEEDYYEEHAGGEGDEDDEYALRQADIVRRQGEVAQMKAQVDAQLEEAKMMLAEKEAVAQQRKKDKQSELRQNLLNHNFAQNVAHQDIQQQQKSVFDLSPQQLPAAVPLFSFPKLAEEPLPPNVSAFGPPKGASSVFLQNFKIPQSSQSPGLENRTSFNYKKVAGARRRSSTPGPEPNITPVPEVKPERELSPELSSPHQDPVVLLEQFSLYG